MSKTVQQQIGNIALVVENYDDAIEFYTQKLQFTLVEDTDLGGGKRWVQVSPPNSSGTNLLLAQSLVFVFMAQWFKLGGIALFTP